MGWALSLRGLLTAPGIGATNAEVTEYYSHRSNGTTALVSLRGGHRHHRLPLVRGRGAERIGDRGPRLFGTVFFGSSILLATLVFVGTALLAAPSMLLVVSDETPNADAVALTRSTAAVVLSVFLPRIATLLMFSTAGLAQHDGSTPEVVGVAHLHRRRVQLRQREHRHSQRVRAAGVDALVSIALLVRRPPQGFELEALRT